MRLFVVVRTLFDDQDGEVWVCFRESTGYDTSCETAWSCCQCRSMESIREGLWDIPPAMMTSTSDALSGSFEYKGIMSCIYLPLFWFQQQDQDVYEAKSERIAVAKESLQI